MVGIDVLVKLSDMLRRLSTRTRQAQLIVVIAIMAVSGGKSHVRSAAAAAAAVAQAAQAAWPYHIAWTQTVEPGQSMSFRLCVNGTCAPVSSFRVGASGWRAPLPLLPEGEHRLVVEACNDSGCVAGVPELVVRISPASGRRPPIDVIQGPRIPAQRR
jgi:hypothetical protein